MTLYYNQHDDAYIRAGQDFSVSGTDYPAAWLLQASTEQIAAIGLQEVIATNSPEDSEYFLVSESLEGATLTYINTPKDLVAVQEIQTTKVRNIAWGILSNSDWMAARAFETGTVIPADWTTFRQAVRNVAREAIAAVSLAQSVLDVKTIMISLTWPPAPIGD